MSDLFFISSGILPTPIRCRSRSLLVSSQLCSLCLCPLRCASYACFAFKGKQVEMYDEEYEPVNGYGFRGTIQGTAVVCHCGCETTMKGAHINDQNRICCIVHLRYRTYFVGRFTTPKYRSISAMWVRHTLAFQKFPPNREIDGTDVPPPPSPPLLQECTGCFTMAGDPTTVTPDTHGNT